MKKLVATAVAAATISSPVMAAQWNSVIQTADDGTFYTSVDGVDNDSLYTAFVIYANPARGCDVTGTLIMVSDEKGTETTKKDGLIVQSKIDGGELQETADGTYHLYYEDNGYQTQRIGFGMSDEYLGKVAIGNKSMFRMRWPDGDWTSTWRFDLYGSEKAINRLLHKCTNNIPDDWNDTSDDWSFDNQEWES